MGYLCGGTLYLEEEDGHSDLKSHRPLVGTSAPVGDCGHGVRIRPECWGAGDLGAAAEAGSILAPVTLLAGGSLGDDAHAGTAATSTSTAGGAEVAAPSTTAIAEATAAVATSAIAAPAHAEATTAAVACAP